MASNGVQDELKRGHTFFTWSNESFERNRDRLASDIRASGIFANVFAFDADAIRALPEYGVRVEPLVKKYPRGWGLWVAKSFLARHVLHSMHEGEVLVYADAGCVYVDEHRETLEHMIAAISGPSGPDNIAYQMCLKEKDWTKSDLLAHLGVLERRDITESGQLFGGIFLLRKTAETVELVRQWLEVFMQENLVNDEPSTCPNASSFIEHRHDQSAWSVLRKLHPKTLFLSDNTPKNFCAAPIQAWRRRS